MGSPLAAATAAWYSLIEKSKINGVEPYLYLSCIMSRLHGSSAPDNDRALVPWNINKSLLLDFDSGHLYQSTFFPDHEEFQTGLPITVLKNPSNGVTVFK